MRIALCLLLVLAGCLDRKLIVRPDPETAVVTVDGLELPPGDDGVRALNFEHYGIRRVVVRQQGYASSEQLVTLDPPWYQITPLDLVTDVLIPWTIEDHREVSVKLEPRRDLQDRAATDALLERAKELSRQ